MDSTTAGILSLAVIAVVCDIAAIVAGEGDRSTLHNAATLTGAIGLLLFISIPIILLYAFLDYAANPLHSYRGGVLAAIAVGALLASAASLVLALVIGWRQRPNSNDSCTE
jgi:hypothetical protein